MLGLDDARPANVERDAMTFSEVVFYIVESADLSRERAGEVSGTQSFSMRHLSLMACSCGVHWRAMAAPNANLPISVVRATGTA